MDGIIPSDYISYKYDQFWWIGMTSEVDFQSKYVVVMFMHLHRSSKQWPSKDDICWLSWDDVKVKRTPPTTRLGHIYDIEEDYHCIFM